MRGAVTTMDRRTSLLAADGDAGRLTALAREMMRAQPDVFEFAIDLKTAKALDLAIPPALRMQVDEIIE